MIWFLIVGGIVLGLMLYLIFAPFCIELNSMNDFYGIKFAQIVFAKIIVCDSSMFMILRIAGWEKRFDLFERRKAIVTKGTKRTKQKKSRISIKKILNMINSFKIKKIILRIDTGNMQLNGILFPLFAWLGAVYGRSISINFSDENIILLRVENNIARLMWAYFK